MIVLKIEDVKEFMSALFSGDMFDRFHVNGCEVTTFVNVRIDGRRYAEWFDTDEEDGGGMGKTVLWQQMKPVVFSIIKGKRTPLKMKMDFCHYMDNGDTASLRIEFDRGELLLYTGYMQREFSPDKVRQQEWDENCENFIKRNKIISTRL